MSRATIKAVFQSLAQVRHARENLLRMQHATTSIRITPSSNVERFTLAVSVEESQYDEARDALITAGATRVSVSGHPSPGWMSHNDGRVTGTGMTPGAGDSEAGSDGLGPRQI